MSEFKPFNVGGNDIVAATSKEEALQVFMSHVCQESYDDLTIDDVEDISIYMGEIVYIVDGEPIKTLGDYVNQCNGEAQYLYGWE